MKSKKFHLDRGDTIILKSKGVIVGFKSRFNAKMVGEKIVIDDPYFARVDIFDPKFQMVGYLSKDTGGKGEE